LKFLVFLSTVAYFLFLINIGNVSLLYADENPISISKPEDDFVLNEKIINTKVSIDIIEKTVETGDEITIKGNLNDQLGNPIKEGQVVIKTESSLNSDGMIAYAITDNNGQYSAKAIAEDWSPQINLYAFYLGSTDQNYLYSISLPQAIQVEFKEMPIIATSVYTWMSISEDHNFLFLWPALADAKFLSPDELAGWEEQPKESRIIEKNIEIFTENSAITAPSFSKLLENKMSYNQERALISFFPAEVSNGVLLKSSSKLQKILPETLSEVSEPNIQKNVEQFVRSWDWGAVIIGLIIGGIVKIILEHWKSIKTLKNIAFIVGAIVLMVLFAISEDNDISNNLQIFDPEQLIQTDSPNYFIFGILFAYIGGWIKEILRDYKIYPVKKSS